MTQKFLGNSATYGIQREPENNFIAHLVLRLHTNVKYLVKFHSVLQVKLSKLPSYCNYDFAVNVALYLSWDNVLNDSVQESEGKYTVVRNLN